MKAKLKVTPSHCMAFPFFYECGNCGKSLSSLSKTDTCTQCGCELYTDEQEYHEARADQYNWYEDNIGNWHTEHANYFYDPVAIDT